MTLNLENKDLALIPGPERISQPFSSVNLQTIVAYTCVEISNALLAIEGIELQEAQTNSMWDWKASLASGAEKAIFEMTCMGEFDEIWGGFQLKGSCEKGQLLHVWGTLRERGYTAVWMHDNDCEMYTIEGFKRKFSENA